MTDKKDYADFGVVIGRFQVPQLTQGQVGLLEKIQERCLKLVVVLGISPIPTSRGNPLGFEERKKMIEKAFPGSLVLGLSDVGNDTMWSQNLDQLLKTHIPFRSINLYGGRDSFVNQYSGIHKTYEVEVVSPSSGTKIREEAGKLIVPSEDFNKGLIYATQNQYPRVIPTVDICVFKGKQVLLGKKPDGKWHFPGGFVDTTDPSYEYAAKRELSEEVDVSVDRFRFLGSYQIDDWRYNKTDRIMTAFYACSFLFGSLMIKEEFLDVQWFTMLDETMINIAEQHQVLLDRAREEIKHYEQEELIISDR